jgi:hypothetical protein
MSLELTIPQVLRVVWRRGGAGRGSHIVYHPGSMQHAVERNEEGFREVLAVAEGSKED